MSGVSRFSPRTAVVTPGDGLTDGIRLLGRDLARVPDDYVSEIRPQIRRAGQQWVQDAKGNAGWSTRIPGSIGLSVLFSRKSAGVYLTASVAKAPHARVYEGIVSDVFRHPVFGNRDTWVQGRSRPYLLPTVRRAYDQMSDVLNDTLRTVLRRHGFDLD